MYALTCCSNILFWEGTRGKDEPHYENFHRYRGDIEEQKIKKCSSPYTGHLSNQTLSEQKAMFDQQSQFRRDFKEVVKDNMKSTVRREDFPKFYVSFNGHPRIAKKQAQCKKIK